MKWTVEDIPDQAGRVAIVTGANAGLGFETARMLGLRGAEVVLACRNPAKAEAALSELERAVPEGKYTSMQLDLGNLDSVARFAADFHGERTRLDLLVNNAGVMVPPKGKTADGFETQFGTNHLGHFALTGHLLSLLRATPDSRVVTLSSIAHRSGRINFNNLHAERRYTRWGAYSQSKLANLMFAYELQRRLAAAGATTLSLAAHPGGTRTELDRHMGRLGFIASVALTQGPEMGALPTLRAATDPAAEGGEYYGPDGILTIRGYPKREKSARHSHNPRTAQRLWEVSETLTGVQYVF